MKQDNPFAKLGAVDQKLYQDTTAKPQEPLAENTEKPATKRTLVKKANETLTQHDTVIPRHRDTTTPRNHATTVSQDDDLFEIVRKSVKQIGKEAATHRFTIEEKNLLADIEYTYKRQGIRTSENEITRIAINYFIEEYLKNGEKSLLAKILKYLNA